MNELRTLEGAYRHAVTALVEAGKDNPQMDAGILLEYATSHGALSRLTAPATPLDVRQAGRFEALIARRVRGEPVHRIIGTREFYGLPLALSDATLVPRPDTEILVDMAVPVARQCVTKNDRCSILDLGTGSGAIALAILNEIPEATALGVDLSLDAVTAARANASALGLDERFSAIRSDWFQSVRGRFDLIVSNPPYIASADIGALDIEVRDHDPRLALDGGVDGLDAYAIIATRALPYLAEGGQIIVEIGHTQKRDVTRYFEAAGFRLANFGLDLAGRDRVLCFVL